jgi:hypothetical protein
MRAVADELGLAISAFKDKPSGENLAEVNGLWARGLLWLKHAKPFDPTSTGGAKVMIAQAA